MSHWCMAPEPFLYTIMKIIKGESSKSLTIAWAINIGKTTKEKYRGLEAEGKESDLNGREREKTKLMQIWLNLELILMKERVVKV